MGKEQLLHLYYDSGGRKLHLVVDKILAGFGGIYQKDYDDFYSLANEVIAEISGTYDGKGSFEGYVYSCLSNRIKTEITRRNRKKRGGGLVFLPLDQPVDEESGCTLQDIAASDFVLEEEVLDELRIAGDERILSYLKSLSGLQRELLGMKMQGYEAKDMKEKLGLTRKQYDACWKDIRSFERTRVLRGTRAVKGPMREEKAMTTQTLEISKETLYSVDSCIDMMDECVIRDDHPLQRQGEQWNNKMKGDLVVTVLHRYPIPAIIIAEQVINGILIQWLLDGKQRLSNLYSFRNNQYKISRNVERPLVKYQSTVREKDGTIRKDRLGNPLYETREIDVRGLSYGELPEEVQKRFDNYTLQVVLYLNCSDDDIEYHIRRYNAVKPMSAAQKGITHLGEQFARVVKAITGMPFFRDMGNYRVSEFSNGTMDRVITESIMAIHFLEDWKKRNEDACAYLKENAKVSHFNHFEELVGRLSEVITKETATLFTSKDSFLWFGLFDRFTKSGLEDERFPEFLGVFQESLHDRMIEGVSFDDLNEKSTKDKNIVIGKLKLLETLMNEYFQLETEKTVDEFVITRPEVFSYIERFDSSELIHSLDIRPRQDQIRVAVQSYLMLLDGRDLSDRKIQQFICEGSWKEEQLEDMMLYLGMLGDWSLNTNLNSALFDKENVPVLIRLTAYACEQERDDLCGPWLAAYAEKFDTNERFGSDKLANYHKMQDSFDRYVRYIEQRKSA